MMVNQYFVSEWWFVGADMSICSKRKTKSHTSDDVIDETKLKKAKRPKPRYHKRKETNFTGQCLDTSVEAEYPVYLFVCLCVVRRKPFFFALFPPLKKVVVEPIHHHLQHTTSAKAQQQPFNYHLLPPTPTGERSVLYDCCCVSVRESDCICQVVPCIGTVPLALGAPLQTVMGRIHACSVS